MNKHISSNSKNDFINKPMDDKKATISIGDGKINVENVNKIKNEEKGIKENNNEGIELLNEKKMSLESTMEELTLDQDINLDDDLPRLDNIITC